MVQEVLQHGEFAMPIQPMNVNLAGHCEGGIMVRMQTPNNTKIGPKGSWRALAVVGMAMLAFHTAAASAWAQREARLPNDDSGYFQWVVAAGLVVVIALPGLLNAKRSHLG